MEIDGSGRVHLVQPMPVLRPDEEGSDLRLELLERDDVEEWRVLQEVLDECDREWWAKQDPDDDAG